MKCLKQLLFLYFRNDPPSSSHFWVGVPSYNYGYEATERKWDQAEENVSAIL